MPAGFKVTLHHVAARAKVSIATVSRALNGLPVGVENLERVKKAANELGYVANDAARSLRSDRTMTVGMLFSNISGALELEFLDSLAGALGTAGYSLLVSTARGDAAQYELLMRRFLERRVDALICMRPSGEPETLGRYLAAGVPVLTMRTRSGAFADLPLMYPSISNALGEALDDLMALGHSRIGVLAADETIGALPSLGAEADSRGLSRRWLKMPDFADLPSQLKAWLATPDRPTAIFAAHREAVALTMACDELGLQLPRDLSVVAIMNQLGESFPARQPFSSVTPHPDRIGQAVGDTMLRWMQGEAPPDEQRVETGVYTARATTGLAPKA